MSLRNKIITPILGMIIVFGTVSCNKNYNAYIKTGIVENNGQYYINCVLTDTRFRGTNECDTYMLSASTKNRPYIFEVNQEEMLKLRGRIHLTDFLKLGPFTEEELNKPKIELDLENIISINGEKPRFSK